nr:PREDICTED: zinc finger protein 90-like [Bemisia tabaci]
MREYHTKEKEWLKVCIQCGRKQRNGKNEKAYIPAKDRENCFRCNTCATRWSRQHKKEVSVAKGAKGDKDVQGGKSYPYHCGVCGQGFAWRTSRDRHARVRHAEVPKLHYCDLCGRVYRWKVSARRHQLNECAQALDKRQFTCTLCPFVTKQKSSLKDHILNVHNE